MADRLNQAAFGHPVFEPVRPWLARLGGEWPAPEALTAFATERKLENARGMPLRFAPPGELAAGDYELRAYASGAVATRPRSWHDLLNALSWLAFPRTKAVINRLHADHLPGELARRRPGHSQARSRLRDALTLFDEGGALVAVSDPSLEALVREHRWRELFWDRRAAVRAGMRIAVLGHAVMEHSFAPFAGITCRALFVPVEATQLQAPVGELIGRLDAAAAGWLTARPELTPAMLPPLPIFGYPGWLAESAHAGFYADQRYFRPLQAAPGRRRA